TMHMNSSFLPRIYVWWKNDDKKAPLEQSAVFFTCRASVRELPGWILPALIRPFITAFVVDLPFCEKPLAVDLDQFVFVVAEAVEDTSAFRIIVGVVEPVRTSHCPVAIN